MPGLGDRETAPGLSSTLRSGSGTRVFHPRSWTSLALIALLSAALLISGQIARSQSSATPLPPLVLNGNAQLTASSTLMLTQLGGGESASAWSPDQISTSKSFSTSFRTWQHDGGRADGLTFTLQSDPAGTSSLGQAGGGLGYSGIAPSVAVELDIYKNNGEPNNNHIGIVENGDLSRYLAVGTPPFSLWGADPVDVWVTYDANAHQLSVYAATNSQVRPTEPLVQATVNLASVLGPTAYAGFTGATGAASSIQEVLFWQWGVMPKPADFTALANVAFSGTVATFQDLDGNTDSSAYSASISWGDGATSTGMISADAAGGFKVAGTHTYSTTTAHAVTVTITDTDGQTVAVISAANRPVVTGLSVHSGAATGGTIVDISGLNLGNATEVDWGSGNAGSNLTPTANGLEATSPAGAGTVDVTVKAGGVFSAATSSDRFSYVPVVTGVSPSSGTPAGGTTVTISGAGFGGTTTVDFGPSHPASNVTVVSANTITASVPSGSGAVDVTVTAPNGTSATSSADRFDYVPLLFTSDSSEIDANGNALSAWTTVLPLPNVGDDSAIGTSTAFAGIDFDLKYAAGEHVILSSDAGGAHPFCVQGSWSLSIAGPQTSTLSGSGSVTGGSCTPSTSTLVDLASLNLPSGTYGLHMGLNTPTSGTAYGTTDVWLVTNAGKPQPYNFSQTPGIGVSKAMTVGGNVTLTVGTTGVLPVSALSVGQPVYGIHSIFGFDPTGLSVSSITFPSGWSGGIRNNFSNGDAGFYETTGSPVTSGGVLDIGVGCLEPGTWPVSFSGNYWGSTGNNGDYAWSVSGAPTVTCVAPAPKANAAVAGLSIDHTNGTIRLVVAGSNLNLVASSTLTSSSTEEQVEASSSVVTNGGALMTLEFPPADPGTYALSMRDASGTLVSTSQQGAAVSIPDIAPLFEIEKFGLVNQIPGIATVQMWRLKNAGIEDGTAIVKFEFPKYLTEPTLPTGALPSGSELLSEAATSTKWTAIVAVPVTANGFVDIPWMITVPPTAVFGAQSSVHYGDAVSSTAEVTGSFSAPDWQSSKNLLSPPDYTQALDPNVNLSYADITGSTTSFAGNLHVDTGSTSTTTDIPFSASYTPVGASTTPSVKVTDTAEGLAYQVAVTAHGSGILSWVFKWGPKGKKAFGYAKKARGLYDAHKNEVSQEQTTQWLSQQNCVTSNQENTLNRLSKGAFAAHVIDDASSFASGPASVALQEFQAVPTVMDSAWLLDLKTINDTSVINQWNDCFPQAIPGMTQKQVQDMILNKYNQSHQTHTSPKVVGSEDPNDIAATPSGAGNDNWITPQKLNYVIHFENDATATAAAINIRVTATLDSNLDPSTLQIGDPSQSSQGSSTQVSYNASTRQITWRLPNIDLPPNTSPPNGEGWVSFSVSPKAGLSTSAAISESAQVFFDYNPPVDTQSILRTLDSSAPVSHVSTLPATESTTTFTVSWSGTDTGSGVNRYTVFASEDGGTFRPWLTDTTSTSASYSGISGHTYGFFTQATDLAGNVEALRSTPDTSTKVLVPVATEVMLSSSMNPATSGQSVRLTATVATTPASSSTPTGTVVFSDGGTRISGCANVSLSSGKASCTVGNLPEGSRSITAAYTPNTGAFESSTSSPFSERVNAAPSPTPTQTPVSTVAPTATPAPPLTVVPADEVTPVGTGTAAGTLIQPGHPTKIAIPGTGITLNFPSLSRQSTFQAKVSIPDPAGISLRNGETVLEGIKVQLYDAQGQPLQDTHLWSPVTITFTLDDATLASLGGAAAVEQQTLSGDWAIWSVGAGSGNPPEPLRTTFDPVTGTFSAEVTHFSEYALADTVGATGSAVSATPGATASATPTPGSIATLQPSPTAVLPATGGHSPSSMEVLAILGLGVTLLALGLAAWRRSAKRVSG